MDFEKKEYLTQHIILSTTLTCLGSKIKELETVKEMWKVVVADVTMKSMLFLLDAEEQLMSMKLLHSVSQIQLCLCLRPRRSTDA